MFVIRIVKEIDCLIFLSLWCEKNNHFQKLQGKKTQNSYCKYCYNELISLSYHS